MSNNLTDYELSLLREGNHVAVEPYAYIAWTGHDGTVEFGPVRWRMLSDGELLYSASPFPGAWTYVKEDQVLRVRHPRAMR